jgi:hypothetical protein
VNNRRKAAEDALSDEQLDMLVQIVLDDYGAHINHKEFADAVLMLFENIAGFEMLPKKLSARYLISLWSKYKSRSIFRSSNC